MKVSAYSYVRNGIYFEYPFLQSIQSVLPIVDEFIMVVGDSADGTRQAIEKIGSPKIKIIDTIWNMGIRLGGQLFAQQSEIGLMATAGDWIIPLQADEVIHENDLPHLRALMSQYENDSSVEGLLFPFLNFRGDYNHIHTGRKSHRFEIRAFKRNPKILPYRDSQGFRKFNSKEERNCNKRGSKLKVIQTSIPIYHYSYVRAPEKMKEKVKAFLRFYMEEKQLQDHLKNSCDVDYNDTDIIDDFKGIHPASMTEVIANQNWEFTHDPRRHRTSLRHALLNKIEHLTGYRIGEFKNYKVIGKES